MAGGRKRGANRSKTKSKLSLGDLVLAKVKGFPAWPAKISRPEDWERSPDPKKYFVQFFGTEEIAFVAPSDIQEFTSEAKTKLSARCQGKTVKDFSRAVKEICEAFEEQQQNTGKSSVDIDIEAPRDMDTVDGGEIEMKGEVDIDGQMGHACSDVRGDEMHGLEPSLHRRGGTEEDIKPSISCNEECLSPILTIRKGSKTASSSTQLGKAETLTSKLDDSLQLKEEVSGDRGEDGKNVFPELHKAEDCSENVNAERNPSSENEHNLSRGLDDDEKDGSLRLSSLEQPIRSSKAVTNGQRPAKVTNNTKKKRDFTVEANRNANSFSASVECKEFDGDVRREAGQTKITPCKSTKESSSETPKSDTDANKKKKRKSFVKTTNQSEKGEKSYGVRDHSNGTIEKFDEHGKHESILFEDQHKADRKDSLDDNQGSPPAKKSKFASSVTASSKKAISRIKKNDYPSSGAGDSIQGKSLENKKLLSRMKAKTSLAPKPEVSSVEMDIPGEESVVPSTKRSRSDCATPTEGNTKQKILAQSKDKVTRSDSGRPALKQVHSRRRVRRFDDDEDEGSTTPVHGKSAVALNNSSLNVPNSVQDTDTYKCASSKQNNSHTVENCDNALDCPSKNRTSPEKLFNESLSSTLKKFEEKRPTKTRLIPASCSPARLEPQSLIPMEDKPVCQLPKNSSELVIADAPVELKVMKGQSKASGIATSKNAEIGSEKNSNMVSDSSKHSYNQVAIQKSRPSVLAEKMKTTRTSLRHDAAVTAESHTDNDNSLGERFDAVGDDKTILFDSKFSDSHSTMRRLIAVAQAKRREAHSHDNLISTSIAAVSAVQGGSSPASTVQAFQSSISITKQLDPKGLNAHASLASPSVQACLLTSQEVDKEEIEDGKVSLGYRAPVGSLSGGTEAAVARDAFEGMIETLSRTKESIGRATRLAIDCAKYGIASEVVELLIRKLECESSYHRKVDLFFLVDSITQCSHSQKGIAGASYIPTVQAALPRLVSATVPPGAGARENRRQCLKVLRLWLERKILPESVLRRYMDNIGGSNDDVSISAGFFHRRPSRAERAIDDPIREMEGMLVDEYGSNATFQLPGLISTHVLEDDEECSGSLCKEIGDESPVAVVHASEDPDVCAVTPSDRRHRILEDVDGELEMEDVSSSVKDQRPIDVNDSFKLDSHRSPDKELGHGSISQSEPLPYPIGSPPLPLDSPPALPPLPGSPPPPPSPLSPAQPLPPWSPPQPPPLPPPLPSQPPPPPPPPPGPLLSLVPQHTVPPQPSRPPHLSMPPQPPLPSPAPLGYQPVVHQEYCRTPNGSQILQMVGNAPHPGHASAPVVKNEIFQQPSPCLVPVGVCNTPDPSGFSSSRPLEFGHGDMYAIPQATQTSQQFQVANTPFAQRPYLPNPPAQTQPSYVSYAKPPVKHQMPQAYPHPYTMPSHPNDRRQFVVDEQRRIPSSELNLDNQHTSWLGGGRIPSCTGPTFAQEGFFRQHVERPPPNNMIFQHPAHPLASGAPIPGRGVPHMPPCRPDIASHNCWRPA